MSSFQVKAMAFDFLLLSIIVAFSSGGKTTEPSHMRVDRNYRMDNSLPAVRAGNTQLTTFNEILQALSSCMPVSVYVDLQFCQPTGSKRMYPSTGEHNAIYSLGTYTASIDTFEFFNDSRFGPMPYFGFSDATIVREVAGDMLQLREVLVGTDENVNVTVTWLMPASYEVAQISTFVCAIQKAASGQVTFTSSFVNLTWVNNFSHLLDAVRMGYNFRFFTRYLQCTVGPKVDASAGGLITSLEVDVNLRFVKFLKAKLITNYQGPGYVVDIVTGTIFWNNTIAFVASDNYVQSFKRVYIEQFLCDMSSSREEAAVDLFMF